MEPPARMSDAPLRVWLALLLPLVACAPDPSSRRERAKGRHLVESSLRWSAMQLQWRMSDVRQLHEQRALDAMRERKAWARMSRNGLLGRHASAWLRERAAAADGTLEALFTRNHTSVSHTDELWLRSNHAAEESAAIEPIAMELNPLGVSMAIRAFDEMPRKGGTRGLPLGFRELGHTRDEASQTDDWGYLVVWMHRNGVAGLVYHSRERLTLAELEQRASAPVHVLQAAASERARAAATRSK